MTKSSFFRRVIEAIAAGKTRKAERFISDYMKSRHTESQPPA
jgi:hypothetical protein